MDESAQELLDIAASHYGDLETTQNAMYWLERAKIRVLQDLVEVFHSNLHSILVALQGARRPK